MNTFKNKRRRKTILVRKKKSVKYIYFLLLQKSHFAAYQGFNLNVTEMISLYCEWACLISLYPCSFMF